MAKIGSKRKSKLQLVHQKWMELDHIADHMKQAMRSAFHPYVADSGRITPNMQSQLDRFVEWCMKHYGKKD